VGAHRSHRFQPQSRDGPGITGTVASYTWTVDTTPPDTTITSAPADPTTSTGASFSFSSTEAGSYQCSLDGGPFAACASPQAYSGLAATSHTFQVAATDGAGNTDPSPASYTWTILVAGPTVTSSSPADGSMDIATSARPAISFSRAIDPLTLNASTLILRRQDGSQAAAAVAYSSATFTATVIPLAPLDVSKTYTVTATTAIKALGDGTPLAAPFSWSFTTTATTGPVRINAGGPANGLFSADRYFKAGSGIATGAAILNTTDSALYQTQRVGSWAAGIWSYTIPVANGTYDVKLYFAEIQKTVAGQRRFNIDLPLTSAYPDIANLDIYAAAGGANRAYSVTIPSVGTCGSGAIRINATAVIDYPAIAAIEVTPAPPTVCSTSPASGAIGVARDGTSVSATFSRQMDAASFTPATFTLTPSGGSPIAATVSYDGATSKATLTPSATLAANTTYTAKLTSAVHGSDGTAMAAYSWTFTTGP